MGGAIEIIFQCRLYVLARPQKKKRCMLDEYRFKNELAPGEARVASSPALAFGLDECPRYASAVHAERRRRHDRFLPRRCASDFGIYGFKGR